MGVVVTNESNMVSYLTEAGNFNFSNAESSSDVAGLSSSGRLTLDLALDPVLLLFPPQQSPLSHYKH